jgi:hypothetical protein
MDYSSHRLVFFQNIYATVTYSVPTQFVLYHVNVFLVLSSHILILITLSMLCISLHRINAKDQQEVGVHNDRQIKLNYKFLLRLLRHYLSNKI